MRTTTHLASNIKNVAFVAVGFSLHFIVMVAYSQIWGWLDPHSLSRLSIIIQRLGQWGWAADDALIFVFCVGVLALIRKKWPVAVRPMLVGVLFGLAYAAYFSTFLDPESSIYAGDYR